MLAQSFLKPEHLGLLAKEHGALVKTLKLLETGALVHTRIPKAAALPRTGAWTDGGFDQLRLLSYTGAFSMDHWRVRYLTPDGLCQTVACIGGTAELVGDVAFVRLAEKNAGLYELFYPAVPKGRWAAITVSQAATALRNYLTTGDPSWSEIVSVRRKSC